MEHLTSAYTAGRSAPINNEARSTPHAAGPKDHETLSLHCRNSPFPMQEEESEASMFARLARQYAAIGLRLYPLDGSTLLVTAPGLGMSRTLPDLRVAKIYLRQIGGGA